jgi:hypothetical protein
MEEIDILLKKNKSQNDQIEILKEKLNELEFDCNKKAETIESWQTEKEVNNLLSYYKNGKILIFFVSKRI